ncbi:DUF3137 family protein [[Mycoplasma] cavipharyngis]|uniref:DUF3137 domain-containing protein n=1 Tax=[Mycoplasma] cavipharyngis TaxID=92757 RepID=UPI003703D809
MDRSRPFKIQRVHESKINHNTFNVDQKKVYQDIYNSLENAAKETGLNDSFWVTGFAYILAAVLAIPGIILIVFGIINSSSIALIILGVIVGLIAVGIAVKTSITRSNFDAILTSKIDEIKIFKMIINNLDPKFKLVSAVDEKLKDYDRFFKLTRIITWLHYDTRTKRSYPRTARVRRKIESYSKLFTFEYDDFKIIIQGIMWSEEVYSRDVEAQAQLARKQVLGCMQIQFKNDTVFQDLNFVLTHQPNHFSYSCLSNLQTTETENPQFNQTFNPKSNNWQRFLQMFTPLTMERFLDSNKNIKFPHTVSKVNDTLHVCFNLEGLFLTFDIKLGLSPEMQVIAENLSNKMTKDMYITYSLLNQILLLPLY